MSQLPDIHRLYTALAEWLACMVYVMALRRRVEGWRLVYLLISHGPFQFWNRLIR